MDQLLQFLEDILENVEVEAKLYIQPPAGMQMVYPCIVITRASGDTAFADNSPFRHQKRYELTAIDEEPVSPLYDVLASLPRARHDRSFPADNLNHDVFTLFF